MNKAIWQFSNQNLVIVIALLLFDLLSSQGFAKTSGSGTFNVYDYGAKGDGSQLDTKAIQAAIDDCAKAGGGKVYLGNGSFLSGTIFFKDNVTLYFESGAKLLGSTNLDDYPVTKSEIRTYTENYTDKSLIYAEKVDNITIMGRGVLDGQGTAFSGPYKVRPYMIRIVECTNVTVKDIKIINSPMWVQHYLVCENVLIDGITVDARRRHVNNDGIDIDSCLKVRIANCYINSGDDAIVLKATTEKVCRFVTVTNCVLSSATNVFKLGTESNGGFQDITLNNCTMYDSPSGISLEEVDGGELNRINVSDVTMENIEVPIFIRLGNRARPVRSKGPGGAKGTFVMEEGAVKPGMGSLKNVIISNIQAINSGSTGCSITGLPDYPVENITLKNIRISCKGGGLLEDAMKNVDEMPEAYPRARMFGTLPAYGFYCRHAKNLNYQHVYLDFTNMDHRPAMVFDDIMNLSVYDVDAELSPDAPALMWFKGVNGAFISGCQPSFKVNTFLKLDDSSRQISLMNNDLLNVGKIAENEKALSPDILYLGSNRK